MFAATTLALLLAAPGDTYTLQWKLKEGDVFYNKIAIAMDQTIEVMGQEMDQKIEMKTVLKFKVKSVKAGATVVEMTYLENKIDAQGLPGVNIGDKLKDVTFTATLNDKMEVTKLEGYDKFLDAISDGDDAQRKLMKAMMPETTIRQSLGQTFALTPAKPVAVGDKWDRTDKMALGPLGNVRDQVGVQARLREGRSGDDLDEGRAGVQGRRRRRHRTAVQDHQGRSEGREVHRHAQVRHETRPVERHEDGNGDGRHDDVSRSPG